MVYDLLRECMKKKELYELKRKVCNDVKRRIAHANRVLAPKTGVDPTSEVYVKSKNIIQYAFDHCITVEEAKVIASNIRMFDKVQSIKRCYKEVMGDE